jgi:shikimate dehydrogenase
MTRPAVYDFAMLQDFAGGAGHYAVLGSPVAHSRSPQMHLAALRHLGLGQEYIRVETPLERLAETVGTLRRLGFAGWNCTLPLKLEMYRQVEVRGASAEQAQAVNTVVVREGKLHGYSTDGEGWRRAVREAFGVDVRDLRIMILGAGGAGQTLAREAARAGCERLVIVNRSEEKAAALVETLRPLFVRDRLQGSSDWLTALPWDEELIGRALDQIDLVVNTTSLGLDAGDLSPLPAALLQPHLLVYDTVYRAYPTPFLLAGMEAGARVSDGLGMLLYQGAAAFTLWTGRPAPVEVMRSALAATVS